jgi:hypothetical protein
VHLILEKNVNTQSLLQHITSKNTSNKDIRNFKHALCDSLMMDTQYPKHFGEEMTSVCFKF